MTDNGVCLPLNGCPKFATQGIAEQFFGEHCLCDVRQLRCGWAIALLNKGHQHLHRVLHAWLSLRASDRSRRVPAGQALPQQTGLLCLVIPLLYDSSLLVIVCCPSRHSRVLANSRLSCQLLLGDRLKTGRAL